MADGGGHNATFDNDSQVVRVEKLGLTINSSDTHFFGGD